MSKLLQRDSHIATQRFCERKSTEGWDYEEKEVDYPSWLELPTDAAAILGMSWQSLVGGQLDHNARMAEMKQVAGTQIARISGLLAGNSPLFYQLEDARLARASQPEYSEWEKSEATEPAIQDEGNKKTREIPRHPNPMFEQEYEPSPNPFDFSFTYGREEGQFNELSHANYLDIDSFFRE